MMDTGMLWFDNNKRDTLSTRIELAVKYYQQKYGQRPNRCFIHPTMIKTNQPDSLASTDGIEIRTTVYILPNHFWLGIDSEDVR
ncbi:MAG: hypothetical protein MUO64_02525 [Anaerolineales bacterium]|nr:hypothetical protein [Anaerolineales bacterium]